MPAAAPRTKWRSLFDELFASAEESHDPATYAEVVKDRVMMLLAAGDTASAEAIVDEGLRRARDHHAVRAQFHVCEAWLAYHVMDWDRCQRALIRCAQSAARAQAPEPVEVRHAQVVAGALQLRPGSVGQLRNAIEFYRDVHHIPSLSSAASTLADVLLIAGDPTGASVAADEAVQVGTRLARVSNWRRAERATLDCSRMLLAGRIEEFLTAWREAMSAADEGRNARAARRLWALRARYEYLHHNPQGYLAALRQHATASRGLAPLMASGSQHYAAVAEHLSGGALRVPGRWEADATLWGLGGMLALGEMLATAGPEPSAREWLRWASRAEDVVTAIDWPVLLDRVVGLVAVRVGQVDLAIRKLRAAADRATLAPIEAEIARLQVAELAIAEGLAKRHFNAWEWHQDASQALLQRGLALDAWLAQIRGAWVAAHGQRAVLQPTPAETEVLQLFAEGLTYQQVAERMGRSLSTVKTLANRAFTRLGADDRRAAIERARRQGWLR